VPTDVEIPDFDTFSRSLGPMLILRRKRKPIGLSAAVYSSSSPGSRLARRSISRRIADARAELCRFFATDERTQQFGHRRRLRVQRAVADR
jgi:hypothetical protein